MSKSILHDLFNGKVIPNETIVSKNPQYTLISDKISAEREFFKGMLSDEDFARLEKVEGMFGDMSSLQDEEAFAFGFRLGAAIMIDVFTGRNELIFKPGSPTSPQT